METVWFAIVTAMLATYVVLDGFDFGAGIVHRFVARTDQERRTVLAAIGPVWDGNEVWLIAAGGVLFMSFPRTYSTAFSGFYLALMIVLWLLILRGVAISFRSEQENPLWREFWDTVFSLASALLAVVFGTSLGNIVRGVPLDRNGLAGMPLFTNFLVGQESWNPRLVHDARGALHALLACRARRFVSRMANDGTGSRAKPYRCAPDLAGGRSAVGRRHAGDGLDSARDLRQSARSSMVNRSGPLDAGRDRRGLQVPFRPARTGGVFVVGGFPPGPLGGDDDGQLSLLVAVNG